jgi:hypothetical protein
VIREYTKGGEKVTFVCYAPELIKSWLRVLLTSPIWRDTVEVPKTIKVKFGSAALLLKTFSVGFMYDFSFVCFAFPTRRIAFEKNKERYLRK